MSDDSFFVCSGFELDRWPIPQATVLFSESINEVRVFVICLPDGSLGIRVSRTRGDEDYETDIIVPESAFRIVLSINYTPDSLSVRINGRDIKALAVGARSVKDHFRFRSISTPTNFDLPILGKRLGNSY